jgi:hypothetical protein
VAGIGGYTPGSTGTNLKVQDWLATIEVPAYEKMVFIPTLDDVGRPYSQKNLRFWDTLATTTLGTTTVPNNGALTFSSGTPTTLALTPSAIYIAVAYGPNQQDQVEVDMGGGVRSNIEAAMAEGCDAIVTAAISNLTAGIGDAAATLTAGDLHKLVTQLRIASPAVMVGDSTIHACLHPGAIESLLDQQTLMNAEIRGDAENPQVRGIFAKASGLLFRFTTKVPTANGNGGEGAVYSPDAFAVGWNSRPRVEQSKDGLASIYIGYANLGGRVKWDSRARYCRTVVSV